MGVVCREADCACETLADEPVGKTPAALADLLRRLGRVGSRTDARRAEAIAEATRTDAARQQGYASTTEWLAALSGEPLQVARSQVAVAQALEQMPATRGAFAAGDLSESRVKALAQAQALAPAQFAQQEATLVAQVAGAPSEQVPQVLNTWKRTVGVQAAEAESERLHQMRALHVSKHWTGLVHLNGDIDPAGGLLVMQALRSLSDPANLDPNDLRTPPQARADALVELSRRFLQADGEGKKHPSRVLVTIPWNTLQEGKGVVDTEAGPIGGQTIRRLTCDATISRVLLDPASVPIEMGKATRVVPDALRRLLELRDQGCTHPGCDRPAAWCDAHHIIHWADGGRTVLANLRLLCAWHHTQAHQDNWNPKRE
jgi:hypothetical protein